MEFDPRTDRLPFNEPDEAEPARAGVTEPAHDARIRHLQRVPLFSGFSERAPPEAELSRIVDVPARGIQATQNGQLGEKREENQLCPRMSTSVRGATGRSPSGCQSLSTREVASLVQSAAPPS